MERIFILVSVKLLAMGSNNPAVLKLAWKRVTNSRLPRVLLYIHVIKMALAITSIVNQKKVALSQCVTNLGTCQNAQRIARIRLATNALYFACRRGKTYPRQPISSPFAMASNKKNGTISRRRFADGPKIS